MKYLSIKQFADALDVHRSAIYARINPGEGKKPSIKAKMIGAYHFIPESELAKWNVAPKAGRSKRLSPKSA